MFDDLVCHCFGFTRADLQRGLATPEAPRLSQQIRERIAQEGCDCRTKSPTGRCCLPAVLATEGKPAGKEDPGCGC